MLLYNKWILFVNLSLSLSLSLSYLYYDAMSNITYITNRLYCWLLLISWFISPSTPLPTLVT